MKLIRFHFVAVLIVCVACSQKHEKTTWLSPTNIYITWGAHDQLSDSVKLTEELANRELDAFLALRSKGVKLDYFLLDMHYNLAIWAGLNWAIGELKNPTFNRQVG